MIELSLGVTITEELYDELNVLLSKANGDVEPL